MPEELEAKLRLDDPAALRAALADAGAAFVAAFTESNRFFDRPGDPLRAAGRVLRLRTETPRPDTGEPPIHRLTVKGPRRPDAPPGLKSRREDEADVADPDATAAVLAALGYGLRARFEKRRERHRLDRCTVEIDELPGAGFFVEVEGPDAATIEAALAALGLADAPREPRGYLTLLMDAAPATPAAAAGSPALFRFPG